MDKQPLDLLIEEIARVLNRDSIDPDIAIAELGVDSMRVVELMLVCDQLYQVDLDPEKLEVTQFTTLRQLDEQFRALRAAQA